MTTDVFAALVMAHYALRMVDASDTTQPQTARTLDAVNEAIAAIERAARTLGIKPSDILQIGAAQVAARSATI